MRLLSLLAFSFSTALAFTPSAQAKDKLTVYTYDSFVSEWGPGPKIKENFEKECDCEVDWIASADGVALLNRLKLEGGNTKADIVLGLDTNLTTEARATGFFAPSGIDQSNVSIPGGFKDNIFVPYDYGYFAVVYDSEKLPNPPKSLKELVEGDASQKIVLQDPRTSTPGLGMLLWMKSVYGDEAEAAWQKLQKRVLTVTPGWSEAYGLFTKGEAPMVLSYTTSPAYHMIAEKTERYKALAYPEGNYLQIELAAQTTTGAKNPLAQKFLAFMTSPGFQDVIPETNWMYPASKTSTPLPAAFDAMPKPEKTLLLPSDEVAKNRKSWVDEWLAATSK
ncbi:thiamine ABC transporter substrate binding subunit [Brucella anthropi]|uniref:Thiamine-binding periplasmic protein n=1 Tax=Brucella anthropi (strain ATCC 49188 / DSM 6882 / CCUG 24695 / JCM 21032 / LMG 3331 / NBRC 15819 / NCTC 12168 / Alc 37) TaxID=439375 RepID=A6WY08_BRUA4|nr:thiamine ABC transporter substrate binding subunit [Brucella anthropi]ABS13862.1 thiamine ABC transporter, periplasmic binding protein [Brucella anthropi ATCC 49188]AIK43198.1 thiamin/thiamine pyrophosphate ABC transporter, thiamin/thiamine pyrophospate-binding protein [Brucella anthropi]KAB2733265.1 thiamine ABC transporter substrate binding subunit [Brucella anthropi]KAB2747491.1 thiamine ABC transporter substrate binding subunit [Brucella anthropi]KAB2775752.1 thiamine ABC transporter su